MIDISDFQCLNDISLFLFGKANYYNRERVKVYLAENGVDWKEWLNTVKNKKKKYCINCGKELNNYQKRFCSRSCSATFNNSRRCLKKINGKNTRHCPTCGKELKDYQRKYCSNKCQVIYQQNKYIDKWKSGEVSGVCGNYGLSNRIRNYLLNKSNYRCEKCGWGELNTFTGKVPLEIHHIDGDYTNNKEENLQVLCPNCHSLTETYKSHNKNGRVGRCKYYKR